MAVLWSETNGSAKSVSETNRIAKSGKMRREREREYDVT
jgi:hypothetical protein